MSQSTWIVSCPSCVPTCDRCSVELQQETIYVEMQERGIAYDVFEVTP